ncbi:ATP-binding protein [Methanoculleus chikugoensis]|uniref:ATP-binding protein n=1 Tax=Methanoculleus chikugoensis TaxID=118126 RepID=UPI0006D17B41|nr:ATP-binding protein [Methanoculleus chikugoensis]
MPEEVKITTDGIITALSKLNFTDKNFPPKAVAEYIWNGFDARASIVEIDYEFSAGGLRRLVVRDNGHGIPPQDQLNLKFQPIFESDKLKDDSNNRNTSQYHGKNGLGRLTFATFAQRARWETVYQQGGEKTYSYSIEILGSRLELFSGLDEMPEESNKQSGTMVTFSDFKEYNHNKYGKNVGETELLDYLKREFCWFLELNKYKGYKLIVNGEELDYSPLIEDEENFTLTGKRQGEKFSIRYVRWKIPPLNQEYSRYYYLDHNYTELHKEYTTLNKKGDKFYHSVFIASKYFSDFKFDSTEDQENITGFGRSDETFKQLTDQLHGYLRRKRKPFLRKHAKQVIAEFEREGIIVKKMQIPFS